MKNKPFKINRFVMLPGELYDTRYPLSSQERILLMFLYSRLYGYGKTASPLSYSVIFSDCYGIIKNNVKLSKLITGLESRGLIGVERADKKTNIFVIEKKHYNNLVGLWEPDKPKQEPKWLIEKCSKMENTESELEKMLSPVEPVGLF